MAEHVVAVNLGVVWEPNAPDAVLVASDHGETTLRVRARSDDVDQRDVVVAWQRPRMSSIGWPNDEASNGHRLWDRGLKDVLWIGEVIESELIAEMNRRNRIAFPNTPPQTGQHHWIVLTKDETIEVVAESVEVRRASTG